MTPCSLHWLRPPGPVAPGLRIGLLGGSFNPPHEGHLHASAMALKMLGLDYVWWLVSPQNPLKPTRGMAPLDRRVADAARLVHQRKVIVTDVERVLGTQFTVDTLTALKRRFPGLSFVWLMGSDNLETFHRWKDWARIPAMMPVAVVMRPGSMLAPLRARAMQRFWRSRRPGTQKLPTPPALIVLDGPLNAQSSTAMRAGTLVG